jgi:hypothetical protein
MRAARTIAGALMLAFVVGCSAGDAAFTLPAGDPQRGLAAFVKFRCFDCHRVENVELPPAEQPNQVIVNLGGEVGRKKSYADLVTGIINPSHRLASGYAASTVSDDGRSRMTVYNDVMSVSELTDIVTFLEEHYHIRPPEPTTYRDYPFVP